MPVYELKEEELVNPPWVNNYEDWKYRRVRIKGRFQHNLSMYIPYKIHNYQGYQFIVPLITKEDKNYDNRHGILVNKGWLPHENKDPKDRFLPENSFTS